MFRNTLPSVLLSVPVLAVMIFAAAAQDVVNGRLEDGDQQSDLWEYYDVYTFEGAEGEAWKFEVKSPEFLPGGMLIDPNGKQVYKSLGNALDKVWATQCRLTASGTWQLVVFESFWQEGDYTLSMGEADETSPPRCDE